jgi:hypothetical protein
LKARKHFFKVFSAVRKVLTCGQLRRAMKHRLHDFSARPCLMAGRAESPGVTEA